MLAEKEGFEPPRRLPDLPHFECGPFSHLGTSPRLCLLASFFKEVFHNLTALISQYTGPNLWLVVEARMGEDVEERLYGASFVIAAAINNPVDPAVDDSASAHRTWLYSNIEGTARQTPSFQ